MHPTPTLYSRQRCRQLYEMLPIHVGVKSELLSHIQFRKLPYFGHVMSITHDNIEVTAMKGLVEGVRNCVRPGISWIHNVVAWTGQSGSRLLRIKRDKGRWSSLPGSTQIFAQYWCHMLPILNVAVILANLRQRISDIGPILSSWCLPILAI